VLALARVIAFFPKEQQTRDFIAEGLFELVNTAAELQWLIRTACTVLTEWRSFAQLRGIFCDAGYAPRDGVRVSSGIKGFAVAAAPEQRYLDRVLEEDERRLALYAAEFRQQGLLPAPEPLPKAKTISAVRRCAVRAVPHAQAEAELAQTPRRRRSPEETKRILAELRSALDAKARV
jgi:hypothetical protein